MKRIFLILCLCVFMFSLTAALYAQEGKEKKDVEYSKYAVDSTKISLERTPVNKFGRGFINTVTCWIELFTQSIKVSRERNPGVGLTLGVVQGVGTSFLRCVTGVFDMATFLIPPYDKPIMKPEYALDGPDEV